jgi:hypothetical protein
LLSTVALAHRSIRSIGCRRVWWLVALALTTAGVGLARMDTAQAAGDGKAPPAHTESGRHPAAGATSPRVIVPESSREKPGDVGKRAHTHYEILDTHGPITPPHPRGASRSKHVR